MADTEVDAANAANEEPAPSEAVPEQQATPPVIVLYCGGALPFRSLLIFLLTGDLSKA